MNVGILGGDARQTEYARRHRQKKRALIQQRRNESGCSECGEGHPATLVFHHRDPETKHPYLKKKNHGKGWPALSYEDLEAEFAKCDVLCANCHSILEAKLSAQAA